MNPALLIFQTRESGFLDYRVPANDVLDDAGSTETLPLDPPTMLEVHFGSVTFATVDRALSYIIERRIEAGVWSSIGTVDDEDVSEIVFSSVDVIAPAFYRAIAVGTGGRHSLPSNVMFLGLPEAGESSSVATESSTPVSTLCTEGAPDVIVETPYRIAGYVDGLFANASSTPEVGTPWDGTFNYKFLGAYKWWTSGESFQFTVNGNRFCRATMRFLECVDGTPTWELETRDENGVILWNGLKSGGETPVGTFSYATGTESSPTTVTVELNPDYTDPVMDVGSIGCAV